MKIPKAIEDLVVSFEKLPGIGPKSAQRLTFYLLHVPQYELDNFSSALTNLKKNTVVEYAHRKDRQELVRISQ